MTTKMKGIDFNAVTMELVMTVTAANKAGKYGTPEYMMVKKLRADYPSLTISVKPKAKTANGLDFVSMQSIIKLCRDSKDRLKTFERVKEISKAQGCPYQYVKNWFLANYANYDAAPEFDAEGFLIVKTKAEMDAEKSKPHEENAAKLDKVS